MKSLTHSFSNITTHWLRTFSLALAVLIVGTTPTLAQNSSTWKSPKYRPPGSISAPGNLSQGGTRSASGEVLVQRLLPLVPQELNFGVTTNAYPSFFVYVPDLTAEPKVETLEFSLLNDVGTEIYRASFAVDLAQNVLRIDLPAQAGLKPLEVDKDYIWLLQGATENFVTSDALLAYGWVRRVVPSESLVTSLAAATTTADIANAYVNEGVWYDAIATLESAVSDTSDPTGTANLAQLNALLQSAGLEGVAVQVP